MSSVDYVAARKAENRADCRYCGMSDDECTTRLLRRQNACCGSCYQTDTHLPAPEPKRNSLHEAIFWQIRAGGMDERALSDWIVRLCYEQVAEVEHHHAGQEYPEACMACDMQRRILALFAIPEGRSTDEQ